MTFGKFQSLPALRAVCRRLLVVVMLLIIALAAQAQTPGTPLQAADVSEDVQELFYLAELFDPSIFSGATGWYLHDGYTYKYFVNSGVHAGVKHGEVFLLGGAYGSSIVPVGSVSRILALLKEKTIADGIRLSRESLAFEYSAQAAYLPAQSFTLTGRLSTRWSLQSDASWISLSRTSGSTGDGGAVTVSVNTSAATLAHGRHLATIRVINHSDPNLSVNLPIALWVTDPGVVVTNSAADILDFSVTHVVNDTKHDRLYFSDKTSKRIYQVDGLTGSTTRYFQFDKIPGRMAIAPDGGKLYVALFGKLPEFYEDTEITGAVGIIDLATQASLGSFPLDIHPYDIAATSGGKVVVSPAWNQWSTIKTYDAHLGVETGSASIYSNENLALHPNEQWLFSATNGLSPSSIEKYDISGEGIASLGEPPYYDYRADGKVWATPDGRYIYTRAGWVFLATSMRHVTTLEHVSKSPDYDYIEDVVFDVASDSAFVLTESNKVLQYSLSDFRLVSTVVSGLINPSFIEIVDGELVVVDLAAGDYRLRRFR